MVVSFRFFLTLNSDDGSKPTPTMETQPVFDGDGKLLHYFGCSFSHSFSGLGKVLTLDVCLSFIIIIFFFNFNFSQCKLGCFNLFKKCKSSQELVHSPLLEGPSVLSGFLPVSWCPTITQPGQTLGAAKTQESRLRKIGRQCPFSKLIGTYKCPLCAWHCVSPSGG